MDIGIAFLPMMAVEKEIKSGKLVNIRINDMHVTRRFNIISHKDRYQPPLFEAFIKHLDLYKNSSEKLV
ncbi:MAG: LysR family transcriptional regulator, transcriptional activator of the cysJI operon [Clostridia bacterium]|nr:LysR family transcriptional regulator, transcriptional activator of the cysJI operon [Clostridia bacterium]